VGGSGVLLRALKVPIKISQNDYPTSVGKIIKSTYMKIMI
jgi:hypothetical protein